MEFFIVLILVVWGIYAICAGAEKDHKKTLEQSAEVFQKIYVDNQFNVSKEIEIENTTYRMKKFVVDDKRKKFGVISYDALEKTSGFACYEYDKLIDFNLYEDGKQQISGNGLATASGALMFGSTGAIIGAASSDREIKTKCMELSVKIQVNDLRNPLITIVLLKDCEKSGRLSSEYQKGRKIADELVAILSYIAVNK